MVRYLTVEEVLKIHEHQIQTYGGSHGIRDRGLLESACAQPMMSFSDEERHKTLFEKAAAYAFFIIKNHPLLDGNKRTGLHTALVFLYLNGIEIDISPEELYKETMALAKGTKKLQDFAAILALHAYGINSNSFFR